MSITTVDFLVEAFIAKKHGWAVAEQFLNTYNGEAFEEQNMNALTYIEQTVRDVFRSNLFNEEANDELEDYLTELREYLKEAKQ